VASVGQVTELILTGRSWTKGSIYGGPISAPGAQPSGNHRTRVAWGAGDQVCGFIGFCKSARILPTACRRSHHLPFTVSACFGRQARQST